MRTLFCSRPAKGTRTPNLTYQGVLLRSPSCPCTTIISIAELERSKRSRPVPIHESLLPSHLFIIADQSQIELVPVTRTRGGGHRILSLSRWTSYRRAQRHSIT